MDHRRIGRADFDRQARLLQALARGSLFRGFTRIDLAPGKFPQAGQWNAGGSSTDQEASTLLDHGHGDAGGWVGHVSFRGAGFQQVFNLP